MVIVFLIGTILITSSSNIGLSFEQKRIMLYYGSFSLLLKLVWLNLYRKCRLYFFYCDGVVHEILTGHKFQWPQESLYCEHLTCSTVKLPIMSWGLIIARLGGFKAPQFATFNRSSWSELRYLNFGPNLKLWWRCPRDSYGLRIPVTPGGIEDFSKRFLFWNNKTSSFCVCQHFYHWAQNELLFENCCNSLLVC